MKKYDFIIGIDPDVDKSGYAIGSVSDKSIILKQYSLWDLFRELVDDNIMFNVLVRLEAGHRIKKTWQKRTPGTIKNVGRNNEIGSQIERFLIEHQIPHELVPPFGGSKVNHDLFCKITGWDKKKKTNPETRVAGLLVHNYISNLK